jgi:hypothetical protein
MLMTDLEKATALIQLAYDRGGGCHLTPELVAALVNWEPLPGQALFSRSRPVEDGGGPRQTHWWEERMGEEAKDVL